MQYFPDHQPAIAARIVSVVANQQGVAVSLLNPATRFIEDLKMYDHLEGVELVLAIEEEFGVEISEADGEELIALGDLIHFVCSKLRSRPT